MISNSTEKIIRLKATKMQSQLLRKIKKKITKENFKNRKMKDKSVK